MSLVKLEGVSLSLNGKTLFNDVNFVIQTGDKIGVVGDNGSGKTSLLRSIAKDLNEHDGHITQSRGLRCQYVEQGFPEQWIELSASEVLENYLPDPIDDRWKIEYTLELCGFPKDYRSLPCNQLSGGWKKIVMIAKAVLLEPDLLLLDEPTNHLDQVHTASFIRLLRDSNTVSTFVVISHNRDFLDSVTQKTLILHGRQVSAFDFSFTRARELLLEQEHAAACSRVETMNEIQRLKKSARFQRQVGVNNYSDKALQKAKKIEKKIKVIEASVPEKQVVRKAEITLEMDEFKARQILRIEGLKLYSAEARLICAIESLVVNRGDRLVITGANGCGKSTLLNAIIDHSEPSIKLNPSVKIAVIDQELSLLPSGSEVLEFVATQFALERQQAINMLAGSGFSYSESQKKIEQLSYGERARLAMLTLRLINPNFLILDEPTNHLDISSQEMLEAEIQRLNPAALIVSHDIRFIENTGTRFFEISDGSCRERR
jgi:ATPase subunit of ABC transporter with duplicated ATPase domains